MLPGLDGTAGAALDALGPLLAAVGAALPDDAPKELHEWLTAVGRDPDAQALDVARRALHFEARELVFARAYEQLVHAPSRRLLGTYFTPPIVVEFMTARLAEALPDPASVADAGAGVGALTLAAARRWPAAEVHAVDVNPASLGLLAVAARAGQPATGRLSLAVQDYLEWCTGWTSLPAPRALLANPPYTRHQARTADEKAAATRAAGTLVPHRTGSLSSYMLAATWRQLGETDALCLLLPDNWLHAAYAKSLRRALWLTADRRIDLYALPEDEAMFQDARVRAMILLVGPAAANDRQPVTVHRTRVANGQLVAEPGVHGSQRTLGEGDHLRTLWRNGIDADGPAQLAKTDPSQGRRPLSDFVLLRRGIATGSNKTFLLRVADVGGVPSESLRPAIHRLSHLDGDVLSPQKHGRVAAAGRPCWLLAVRDERNAGPAAAALLQAARDAGVPDKVLCGRRAHWYALEFPNRPPKLIVSPSAHAQGRFRVVRNDAGARTKLLASSTGRSRAMP